MEAPSATQPAEQEANDSGDADRGKRFVPDRAGKRISAAAHRCSGIMGRRLDPFGCLPHRGSHFVTHQSFHLLTQPGDLTREVAPACPLWEPAVAECGGAADGRRG